MMIYFMPLPVLGYLGPTTALPIYLTFGSPEPGRPRGRYFYL
jgi:hypothetical protein